MHLHEKTNKPKNNDLDLDNLDPFKNLIYKRHYKNGLFALWKLAVWDSKNVFLLSKTNNNTKTKTEKQSKLKALVNIVVDRLKKIRTVLADLYNYVQVDE